MKLEDYVMEMKDDIKDIQKDVKDLIIFMAIEKEKAKRQAMLAGGAMSLVVSLIVIVAQKVLA